MIFQGLRRCLTALAGLAVALGLVIALPAAASAAPTARQEEPVLSINKFHIGSFQRGQTGTYRISVSNTGEANTTGTVEVEEIPPTGLTVTDMHGGGWSCTLATLTCTTDESLAPGLNYLDVIVTVAVANDAPASVTNRAEVSGGGSASASAEDPTDIITVTPPPAADLSINKSHSGTFPQGGTGTYTLAVSNAAGAGTTSGEVTVTDILPTGVTLSSVSGTGWTCSPASGTVTCRRSDPLAAGGSYDPITLTVNVTASAACSFTNSATVSGGGSGSETANDSTAVSGGTCAGGNGGNGGGGSILPINLSGVFPMFNNISINHNIKSPGATNTTNQTFDVNAP
ncbi:DUF11 domain-containing protein [Streptomyces sp. Tue6028]|uniref:DUF11 domain-containing protein n=1 Tax=Streptomyces sp. Tue6028 TaxID=2036037 RepID=UPI003D75290B